VPYHDSHAGPAPAAVPPAEASGEAEKAKD
jgi:hypothetical protein